MSPRIVESKRCPHCKAALPEPTPRVCPQCAGSLQKRFLSLGCLTSAPPVVLVMLGAAFFARAGERERERTLEAPPHAAVGTIGEAEQPCPPAPPAG